MLQGLTHAVDQLGAGDVEAIPTRELGERLVAFRRLIDRQEAQFSKWLGCFDRRQGYRLNGSTSAVAWLRSECGLSGGGAAQRVEVARGLSALPEAADLFASGEIGFHHAAVLARTAAEIGPRATEITSKSLVEAATQLTPDELRLVGRRLRHTADPEGELAQQLRSRERRRLHLSEAPDGMVIIDGLLDAEGGAVVRAAIEPLCKPFPRDDRTPDQRRADALVELANRQLQTGTLPSSGGVRPQVMITVTKSHSGDMSEGEISADSTETAEIAGVGPIPTATFERLSCDSAVSGVTVGADGAALSAGRTRRSTPPPLRRALVQRDRGCAWPGCDRRPAWTESHHIRHWTKHNGPTELSNLALLCRAHHRYVHEGGWNIALVDGKVTVEPP